MNCKRRNECNICNEYIFKNTSQTTFINRLTHYVYENNYL